MLFRSNYLLKINFIKFKAKLHSVTLPLVRVTGLEPAHLTAQEPKGRVTTVELYLNHTGQKPNLFNIIE